MLYLRYLILKGVASTLGMSGFIPEWPVLQAMHKAFATLPGGRMIYSYIREGPCPCPLCTAERENKANAPTGEIPVKDDIRC